MIYLQIIFSIHHIFTIYFLAYYFIFSLQPYRIIVLFLYYFSILYIHCFVQSTRNCILETKIQFDTVEIIFFFFNYHEYYLFYHTENLSEFSIRSNFFFLSQERCCYKTPRAVQIRRPVISLFSKVSNMIEIRIRSWEEVRYSNELANLLPDPVSAPTPS